MEKAPDAFRTISEVGEDLDIPQHVLRFWESRFPQIKPMKRAGGRRYYRPDDVALLRGIRHLLYGEGYTIRGVQRILREQGLRFVQEVWIEGAAPAPPPVVSDAGEESDHPADDHDAVEAEPPPPAFSHDPIMRREPAFDPPPPRVDTTPTDRIEPRSEPRAEAPAPPQYVTRRWSGLKPEQIERLNATLADLEDGRRLLDAALEPAA